MKPRAAAILRLYGVQAAWTYERMAGIGVGHASAPLLRDLYASRPAEERRAAVARSAEFFNSHPYLAGVAVGAVVRAEQDGVAGTTISRLRTALSGPLGAIGDQLVWTGEVPALIGLALAAIPWLGGWAVLIVVLIHNILRYRLTVWGLDLGLREGLGVGAALQRSWLPAAAHGAQQLAAFAVGLAIPVAATVLLPLQTLRGAAAGIAFTLAGAVLTLSSRTRSRITALRLGLVLMGAALVVAVVWR
jgi:PTS system mannose-specific IID component